MHNRGWNEVQPVAAYAMYAKALPRAKLSTFEFIMSVAGLWSLFVCLFRKFRCAAHTVTHNAMPAALQSLFIKK